MLGSKSRLFLPLVAGAIVAVGCGGGDDPVEPDNAPPDLTGTYSLQSFTSTLLTGGNTLTPPGISGTFTLQQSPATGSEASGTFTFDLNVPDAGGNITEIMDQGVYTVRFDGSWEQAGQLQQGSGTYTLQGETLTVEVTEPPISVSTTVWQRQ